MSLFLLLGANAGINVDATLIGAEMAAASQAVTTTVITLTGGTIIDTIELGPCSAGVRINTDGTVDGETTGSYTQLSTSTDWIIPNAAASDKTYHVKATEDSWTAGLTGSRTGTTGSWIELSSNYLWKAAITGDNDDCEWVITVAISGDGGTTTIDSGQYTLSPSTSEL